MSSSASTTVRTWEQFQQRWDGVRNFLLADACVPFEFDLPPIDRVVAEMRGDELVRITPGTRGDRLHLDDTAAEFRLLPVEQAIETPFALAHFELARFDAPGKFLHGFDARVMEPWRQGLAAAGFTVERCVPIIFMSGRTLRDELSHGFFPRARLAGFWAETFLRIARSGAMGAA